MAYPTNRPNYNRSYGIWAGNPKGTRPDYTKCAHEVVTSLKWNESHQCSRSCGHGPNGAFCKQHAKLHEVEA